MTSPFPRGTPRLRSPFPFSSFLPPLQQVQEERMARCTLSFFFFFPLSTASAGGTNGFSPFPFVELFPPPSLAVELNGFSSLGLAALVLLAFLVIVGDRPFPSFLASTSIGKERRRRLPFPSLFFASSSVLKTHV